MTKTNWTTIDTIERVIELFGDGSSMCEMAKRVISQGGYIQIKENTDTNRDPFRVDNERLKAESTELELLTKIEYPVPNRVAPSMSLATHLKKLTEKELEEKVKRVWDLCDDFHQECIDSDGNDCSVERGCTRQDICWVPRIRTILADC